MPNFMLHTLAAHRLMTCPTLWSTVRELTLVLLRPVRDSISTLETAVQPYREAALLP